MNARLVTPASILRLLVWGFALVILLLMASSVLAVRGTRAIQEDVAHIVYDQLNEARLIAEIQGEASALTAILGRLQHDPSEVDRDSLLRALDDSEQRIERIVRQAAGSPDEPLWRELRRVSQAFSADAHKMLETEDPAPGAFRNLFRHHDETIALLARLTSERQQHAAELHGQIVRGARDLQRNSLLLLTACLILALASAALTMRMAAQLFRRLDEQSRELSRVSWHMLENQEAAARRLSHELHDELGQTLTAIKANLVAVGVEPRNGHNRLEDCVQLIDGALGNVREISQLLRPTILDDFGLDAGLRWLCERFAQRTGIEVQYSSHFSGRLDEQSETHLFRIAQEALTNAARHSGATRVSILLRADGGIVELSISDNGRGLPSDSGPNGMRLGMVGMRARAREAGGELIVGSRPAGGVTIQVSVPARQPAYDKEDSYPIGR